MTDQTLTEFQQSAERAISALLAERGVTIEQREVLNGTMPFYSKEPQTALRLRFDGMEVWLLADAASVSGGGRDGRFERAGFGSTDELLAAILKELRTSALAAPKAAGKKRPK